MLVSLSKLCYNFIKMFFMGFVKEGGYAGDLRAAKVKQTDDGLLQFEPIEL